MSSLRFHVINLSELSWALLAERRNTKQSHVTMSLLYTLGSRRLKELGLHVDLAKL